MNEQERNELVWRAFQLGMIAALHANGLSTTGEPQSATLRLLGEIARGEATTSDPTAMAAGMGDVGPVLLGIGNASIRHSRELAGWAVAGLDRAAEVPDE